MGGAGGGSVLGRLPAVVYCELLGGEPRRLGVEPRARLRDPQHARARRGVAARQYGAQRGAVHAARRLGPGHTVVTVLCDSGARYMSTVHAPAGAPG